MIPFVGGCVAWPVGASWREALVRMAPQIERRFEVDDGFDGEACGG